MRTRTSIIVASVFLLTPFATAHAQFETTLFPSVTNDGQKFGVVAADGSSDPRIVVGAPGDDAGGVLGSESGAAYVFHFENDGWVEKARLFAPTPDFFDDVGSAAAISGDVIMLYADEDQTVGQVNGGAVHVFRFDGNAWNYDETLLSSDQERNDAFAAALALEGNLAVFGTASDDDGGFEAGAAYVFEDKGNGFEEVQKLIASTPRQFDLFGTSVAICPETRRLLVGALFGDAVDQTQGGSAYVFAYNGSEWVQEDTLIADDPRTASNYGLTTEILGNWAMVGSDVGGSDTDTGNGTVYIYKRTGVSWDLHQRLYPTDNSGFFLFGHSMDLETHEGDTTLAVGAPNWFPEGKDSTGKVYRFRLNPVTGQWEALDAVAPADGGTGDNFGDSVALLDGALAVGSPRFARDVGRQGAAYVYGEEGGTSVGIESIAQRADFRLSSVYPNPSAGPARASFAIPSEKTARLETVDVLGRTRRVLFEGRGSGVELQVGLPQDLPPGTYWLRLTLGDGLSVAKPFVRLR